MSYSAVVKKIFVRPLPGADRLQIGTCGQYQVVVGIDVKDGDLGVFFETDGQLSEEFCEENDLLRRKEVQPDGTVVNAGGMFEENRHVKSIKLRGVRSDGFWTSIDSFAYCGPHNFKVDNTFTQINDHLICEKYMTPATRRRTSGQNNVKKKFVNLMFKEHIDTGNYKRECQVIPPCSIIYVSEKLHGTSFRYGNVLHELEFSWVRKQVNKVLDCLGIQYATTEYRNTLGSCRMILDPTMGTIDQYRRYLMHGIHLNKGEVIYGEIVGFDENNTPIMDRHNMSKQKFKFSDVYAYGCRCYESRTYIYCITQVNEDGHVVELSWNQLVKCCKELGLNTVPHLQTVHWWDTLEALTTVVNQLTECKDNSPLSSTLDSSTLREGVVVRYESERGFGWLKNKAFAFGVLEGHVKENTEYVDTEEAA